MSGIMRALFIVVCCSFPRDLQNLSEKTAIICKLYRALHSYFLLAQRTNSLRESCRLYRIGISFQKEDFTHFCVQFVKKLSGNTMHDITAIR